MESYGAMRELIVSVNEPINGFVTSWLLGRCAGYFSVTVTNDHEQKQLEKVGLQNGKLVFPERSSP